MIRYTGRAGSVSDVTPAEYAELKYRAGWRELRITRDGEQVGAIFRNLDTGQRDWWGER